MVKEIKNTIWDLKRLWGVLIVVLLLMTTPISVFPGMSEKSSTPAVAFEYISIEHGLSQKSIL
ncbi:MAG: hypothetical protein GY757_55185, partial [bacterium]|nr:hypothetical protein [bacterium]